MNETNLGKIHIFPSEDSYNSNKGSVGSSDLALVPNTSITGLSVSGKTITYTKGDGTTGTITTQDTNTGIVAQSLGTNGYVKFANGLILQWGSFNIGHSVTLNVTFPIAFVSSFYAGTTQSSQTISDDSYNNGNKIISVTLSSMTIRNNEQGGLVYWMAIGK